ncbi:hypothetical protein ACMU_18425 [Actibacterium mucosum KCTC 23349]|uniref:Ribose ABC transporter permease n=1 Tax=Actibacterium mucosum KCTC 23349 TaxID=1454373 RepID=A0A037ZD79_9RHOB|nr:hypothetical protein [Actibacterium mucosum]KAJ54404.1 hypothetical protein ACMU_18425 [Actibacterium mucosum KCTC 23349]
MSVSETNPRRLLPDFSRGGGILIAFIVLCVALSFASPYFLTVDNLFIVARQSIFIMIMALAMTFVIGMGGIDLSVGAVLALCGAVTAWLLLAGYPTIVAVIAAMALGTVIGGFSGVLIAYFGMTDFIVTLGVMSVVRGIIMVFTEGVPFFGLRIESFQYLAQGYLGPVPVPVAIGALLFVGCWILLNRTPFGRQVVAIGSNAEAARLNGTQVRGVKVRIYMLSGLFAGIAGVLLTSRLEAAMPEAGLGYELDVIAAVVIGGTSLAGGRAMLFGTVLGALVMGVVRNGLNLLEVNTFWHQVVIGAIILIAVGVDKFSNRASR